MTSQLGHELRRVRERAGLSGRQLAKAIRKSQSFISRVENGIKIPSDRELRSWATATGADHDTLGHLRKLNEQELDSKLGRPMQGIETRAESIHVFDPIGVPALLWTPMYAWQLLQAADGQEREAYAAFVEQLQRRQQPLLTGDKHYEFIFTERALPSPDTSANRGLIGRILSLEGMAKITVITDRCPLLALARTGFTLYDGTNETRDLPAVGITTLHSELAVTAPHHVALYRTMFEQLATHATEIRWPHLSAQTPQDR